MHVRTYVGKWIAVLYRMMQSYFDRFGEPYGISSGHVFFLLYLYRREGGNQDTMSKDLNVDKATTARAIATLETLGYVMRRQDAQDKRAYNVYLTEQGRKLEPAIRTMLKAWAGILTKDFSREEHELAYRLMQRMAENSIAAKSAEWKSKGINRRSRKGTLQ